jgi:ATP-binding cassette, subfamily B, multidrug efflux pump
VLARLLIKYVRPYRQLIVLVVILQAIQTAANLYLPKLNADIIDSGIAKGDSHYIWTTGLFMLLLSALQAAATIAAVYFGANMAAGFGRDLRAAIFNRVMSFSAREIGSFGAPTLITRNTNDVQQVQMVTVMTANMLVSMPITLVGGVIMALHEDARLAWLLVICVPAMVGALGLIIVRLVPNFRKMQVRIDNINRVLREQLTGMRVVRAFVRERHETGRFAKANRDVTEVAMKVGRLQAFMFPIINFVFNTSSVLVLWFGAHQVSSGRLQVGGLIAFIAYLAQILLSVMMATFVASMIPRASVCAERITETLSTASSVILPSSPVTSLEGAINLQLNDVEFHYPGAEKRVLEHISLSVNAGEMIAIIGSTGVGKTTLINLIPRLMDATSGSVTINGVDVREISPELLAQTVGLVPQQPYLFSGTIASNLRYGNPHASDEDLWRALRIAQAEDFVKAMPEGLDAPISQGGTTVSGGQRQRLAIARALVHQPAIYLFDDSFSALDVATDAKLRAALATHVTDAITLVVAQRVSSIKHAHQIIVMEDGCIVGKGTHEELLVTCTTYKEIVDSQLTAEEAA